MSGCGEARFVGWAWHESADPGEAWYVERDWREVARLDKDGRLGTA